MKMGDATLCIGMYFFVSTVPPKDKIPNPQKNQHSVVPNGVLIGFRQIFYIISKYKSLASSAVTSLLLLTKSR